MSCWVTLRFTHPTRLIEHRIANWGDTLVIVSGTKVGMRGGTNMMKIDWIGSDECRLYPDEK